MRLFNFKTKQDEEIPSELAQGKILSGEYGPYSNDNIPVLDAYGKPIVVKGSELGDMLKSGHKLPTEDIYNQALEGDRYDNSNLQASVAGVLRGISFGLSDEALTNFFGVKPEVLGKLRRYNPYLSGGAELGGAIIPAVLSEGAASGAIGKIASKLPTSLVNKVSMYAGDGVANLAKGVLGADASNIAKTIATYAGKGLGSAVEGAMYGTGNYITEDALGEPGYVGESMFSQALEGAKWGGLVGIGIPAGLDLIQAGIKKSPAMFDNLATKMVKTYAGISDENIKAYLENPALYDDSLTKEEVLGRIQNLKGEVDDKLASKQMELEDANKYYTVLQDRLKDKGKSINEFIKDAKKEVEDKLKEKKLEIKEAPIPQYTVEDAGTIVKNSNEIRNKSSDESLEILSDYPDKSVKMDTQDLLSYAQDESTKGFLGGKPMGPIEHAAAKANQEYINDLTNLIDIDGEKASLPTLKIVLKKLDKDIRGQWGVGTGGSNLDFLKNIRTHIDTFLKENVPEYKEKMKEVYELSQITNYLNGKFGYYDKPEFLEKVKGGLLGILKGAQSSNVILDYLKNAENLLPNELKPAVSIDQQINKVLIDYRFAVGKGAQQLRREKHFSNTNLEIKSILDDIKNSEQAQSDFSTVKKYLDRDLNDYLEKSVLDKFDRFEDAVKIKGQTGKIAQIKQEIDGLKDQLKIFNPYKDEYSGIDALNRAAHSNEIKIKKLFGRMTELGDEDFAALVNRLRIQDSFNTPFLRGSRNVLLWKTILGGIGAATGATFAGPIGGLIGAALGAITDQYGPKIAKGILNSIAGVRGSMTASKLQKAFNDNIPEEEAALGHLKQQTLLKAEKDVQEVTQTISKSLSDYLSKPITAAKIYTSKVNSDHFDYDKAKQRVNDIVTDRKIVNENFYNKNQLIQPIMPNTLDNYFATYQRAVDFLDSKLPRPGDSDPFNEFKPTNLQQYNFAQYAHYLEHPTEVLKEIKSGTIPEEGIEVLQAVYPSIYNKVVQELTSKLSNMEEAKKIPIAKRNELKRVFGFDLNPSSNFQNLMQLQQNNVAEQLQQQQELNNQQKGMKKLGNDLSQGMKTDLNRITSK